MLTVQIISIVVALAVTVAGIVLVARTATGMVRLFKTGQPNPNRNDEPAKRLRNVVVETLGHTRMLRWSVPGAAHWFVFVGFGALFGTLVQAYGELFDPHFHLPLIGEWAPYLFFVDTIAALTLVAILTLITLRLLNMPSRASRRSRFVGSNAWMAYYVEYTVLTIALCVLTLRGLTQALEGEPTWDLAHWASYPLAELFDGAAEESLETAIIAVAAFKITVSMAWFCVIALNANMGIAWHRFTAFFNIYFKRHADGSVALGAVPPVMSGGKPVDFEDPGDEDLIGVGQVEHFTWKAMLDFATCTECGRCQSQCPAWNTGKPLSPKLLVMSLRDHQFAKAPYLLAGGGKDMMGEEKASEEQLAGVPATALAEAERPLVGGADELGVIDPEVLWSCTTCGACVEQCPVDIEHVDHIIDMRRYQVLIESSFPSEAGVMLKNMENKGNPWGMNASSRLDWTEDLPFEVRVVEDVLPDDVEYLYWVGCAGALEDRAKKTTRAFAELLHTAGVEFAILGPGEACSGDPARRLGNEFLFSMMAQQNVETLNAAFGEREPAKRKIVASCPHCFNSLNKEYPQLGGDYEVVHHTQLLGQLVDEGRLVPVERVDATNTYHDPCYLGRHNKVYTPPREVLGSIQGLSSTEMHRCKDRGFCCGAGGARMWMEEKIGKRINVDRTEEALSLDPDMITTACPFCLVMLSDAVTAKKQSGDAREETEVLDVAQVLARSLRRKEPVPVGAPAGAEAGQAGGTADAGPAGGAPAVTPDVVHEGARPVADDPVDTETADYPQLTDTSRGDGAAEEAEDGDTARLTTSTDSYEAEASATADPGDGGNGSAPTTGGDVESAKPTATAGTTGSAETAETAETPTAEERPSSS